MQRTSNEVLQKLSFIAKENSRHIFASPPYVQYDIFLFEEEFLFWTVKPTYIHLIFTLSATSINKAKCSYFAIRMIYIMARIAHNFWLSPIFNFLTKHLWY